MGKVLPSTEQSAATKATKFNPGASYKWEPTDQFVLDGNEFSVILHTLRTAATQPQGAPAIALTEAHKIMENLLIEGVEAGVIKEQPQEAEVVRSTEPVHGVPLP